MLLLSLDTNIYILQNNRFLTKYFYQSLKSFELCLNMKVLVTPGFLVHRRNVTTIARTCQNNVTWDVKRNVRCNLRHYHLATPCSSHENGQSKQIKRQKIIVHYFKPIFRFPLLKLIKIQTAFLLRSRFAGRNYLFPHFLHGVPLVKYPLWDIPKMVFNNFCPSREILPLGHPRSGL